MNESREYKDCVACAEKILAEARLCKYCKTNQVESRYHSMQATAMGQASIESRTDQAEPLPNPPNGEVQTLVEIEGGGPTRITTRKVLVFAAVTMGILSLLAAMLLLPNSQSPELNSRQSKMLDDFLISLSDGADEQLKIVATCVVISYDELNATFMDSSARSVALARVQDCVESRNSRMTCGEADDGTGPLCGIAGTRTGYSISSVFGAMMGLAGSDQPATSIPSADEAGAPSTTVESVPEYESTDAQSSPNTSAPTSGGVDVPEQEEEADPQELNPSPSPEPVSSKVWVPTLENIKVCSLDYWDDSCPHDNSSSYLVEKKNTFGVNAQQLVEQMISAGICNEWPKENKVWPRPTIENACLGDRDAFYVATGDVEIWELIYASPYGEVFAAGDGWVVYAIYTSLEDMQIVANLLDGVAWRRGF